MISRITFLRVLLLFLIAVLLIPLGVAAGDKIATGFGRFHLESAKKQWSFAAVTFADGAKAEKFELRAGDCKGTDCKRDRERVEKAQDKGPALGKDIWVAWSVYLPANFPRQGPKMRAKIGQWHLPKYQGKGQGPTALFEIDDTCLRVTVKDPNVADTDPMRPAPDLVRTCIATRKAMLGHWTRFMVNAKWSMGADGYLRIFVNGKLKWSHQGRTINVPARPYFRYGLYRSFISRCGGTCPTLISYYRDVRQGKSRKQVE